MTPLFWIALTWVLATFVVGRLPLHQRYVPGGILMLAALPMVLSIGLQMGWLIAALALVAIASLYPNPLRLAQARYRGEAVTVDINVLRYLVVPGEI